jgi:peptidyl-prolyl cis-trans isomerase C
MSPRTLLWTAPLAIALVLAAGCGKQASQDGKVLAVVNGQAITESDLEHYLPLRRANREPPADPAQERRMALEELIDRALLAQYAESAGLDKDPEVRFTLEHVRTSILAQAAIRKALREHPVSDEEIKQRFEQEVAKAHKTEYKVRHILVKTEDEAKDIVKQLEGGANFAALARSKSLDPGSAKQGGVLPGWVNQGSGYVPAFFQAVTTLKKGEFTHKPVQTEYGWHVIKVDDTRALELPSLEALMADPRAQAGVRRQMQEERVEKLLQELKAKAKLVMAEETKTQNNK